MNYLSNFINIKNILYSSDALTKLRQSGYIKELSVKTNREDLSTIKVLNPVSKEFFDVPAVDQEYTRNLTLHQHDIIKKYRNKHVAENTDELSLAEARQRIEDIIEREIVLNRKMKISASKQLANFRNVEGGGNSSVVSDEQKAKIEAAQPKNSTTDGHSKKTSGLGNLAQKLKKARAEKKDQSHE
jgi:hypothetical protein